MAQGFPDYFGELVLPVTVPNGGTGATSFTADDILTGNGASAIQSSGIQISAVPRKVSLTDATHVTANTNFGMIFAPKNGVYRLSACGMVFNNSGGSLSLYLSALFTWNSVSTDLVLAQAVNNTDTTFACGGVVTLYADAGTAILLGCNPVGFASGDYFEQHGRLEQID